jgi:hypothetical protein
MFSSCLFEVELPNMWKFISNWGSGWTAKEGGDSMTDSWLTLEDVILNINDKANLVSYLEKLLFGSGVLRPSVKRIHCSLKILLSVGSNEAHLLMKNLPNLTHLTLKVNAEEVELLRSLIRRLPSSCLKIQLLELTAFFPLGDGDFLGVNGEEGLVPSPLLQLPGK